MRILAIDASFRLTTEGLQRNRAGLLSETLDEMCRAAEAEGNYLGFPVETKHYYLHEELKATYSGWYTDEPEWIKPLLNDFRESDGFFFGIPVAWGGINSHMQSLFEHITALEHKKFELSGKVFGAVATFHETGGNSALERLSLTLQLMGLEPARFGFLWKNDNMRPGSSEDDWQNTDAPRVGQNVVRKILQMQGYKIDDNNWKLRTL